jgi:hypothetical protein
VRRPVGAPGAALCATGSGSRASGPAGKAR